MTLEERGCKDVINDSLVAGGGYEAAGKSYVLDIPGTLTLALATPSPLAWRTDDDHASTCVRLRRV